MSEFYIFQKVRASDEFQKLEVEITKEIKQKKNEYILNVNDGEWEEYFVHKYELMPLKLFPESTDQKFITKEVIEKTEMLRVYDEELCHFEIYVPFTGSSEIFRMASQKNCRTDQEVRVEGNLEGNVIGEIVSKNLDKFEFNRKKNSFLQKIEKNLEKVNQEVERFNKSIKFHFQRVLKFERSRVKKEMLKHQEELDFFKSIDVDISINKNTVRIFEAPVIKKKKIPEPKFERKQKLKYDEIPTFGMDLYEDVLKIIYDFFKNVEKKPNIYNNKDEEGLRDYLLPMIETRYSRTTVTGETFNKKGKTDILVKYEDGTNLFVAECKIWKGKVSFHKTIDQLFNRYLTWRDSKVAIILFVENKDFSAVLDVIKEEVKKHPYYFKENGNRGETSFSYIFNFPDDSKKKVFTEIMAFSFNQK